jgi:hypothetical protein
MSHHIVPDNLTKEGNEDGRAAALGNRNSSTVVDPRLQVSVGRMWCRCLVTACFWWPSRGRYTGCRMCHGSVRCGVGMDPPDGCVLARRRTNQRSL